MVNRMSRKAFAIMAIAIIAVGAVVGIALSRDSVNPSDSTLPVVTWNETTLSTLEGSPVVLNFWSIGCYWCRYQLPFLETVAQQSEGQLEVIAVNTADSASGIRTFFGDYEPTMTIAVDENRQVFRDYSVAYNNTGQAIPFTLFIDSEGAVKYAKLGAFASEAQLWDTLNDVLGITAPETPLRQA
jgi:thiol-disulfide isomerase/thioredoxin